MNTKKLIVHETNGGAVYVTDNHRFADAVTLIRIDNNRDTDPRATAAELVRRHNAYPELVTALADMVSTANEVEGMMDGDKDKQEAWTEELGRLYVALDAAKALLNTL